MPHLTLFVVCCILWWLVLHFETFAEYVVMLTFDRLREMPIGVLVNGDYADDLEVVNLTDAEASYLMYLASDRERANCVRLEATNIQRRGFPDMAVSCGYCQAFRVVVLEGVPDFRSYQAQTFKAPYSDRDNFSLESGRGLNAYFGVRGPSRQLSPTAQHFVQAFRDAGAVCEL